MNCLFIYDGEIIEIECIMETDQSCVFNIQYYLRMRQRIVWVVKAPETDLVQCRAPA